MKRLTIAVALLLVVAGVFLAGQWTGRGGGKSGEPTGRKILYYVDPMHPSYKSDKPGIAPDCGMELVPVYDDGSGKAVTGETGAPGAVRIDAEAHQRIGVRVEAVKKAGGTKSLRILGRVAVDENRLYRVIAGLDGRIEKVLPPATGSLVTRGQSLALLISPDSLSAQQGYINAIIAPDRLPAGSTRVPGQRESFLSANQRYYNALRNLGFSESQIEEIGRTRTPAEYISVVAPTTGVILARNAFSGQRIEKGAEMYRIADLSRVWILADVFENEAGYLRPGTVVKMSIPGRQRGFQAKVSDAVPQFDGTTRTVKVRLEVDNPGFVLWPDMFVDLDLPVNYPAALVVPVNAVVDSGLKKIVYVEKEEGVFVPRRVEVGWRHGDQAEIVSGLMPGERIVVSGTFLIDSESRLKAAAAGVYGESSEDPVCGVEVDQSRAKAAGRTVTYQGETFYFSSDECKTDFQKTPARYVAKAKAAATPSGAQGTNRAAAGTDPRAGHADGAPSTPSPEMPQTGPGAPMPMPGAQPPAGQMPPMSMPQPQTGPEAPMPMPAPRSAAPEPPTGSRQPAAGPQAPSDPRQAPALGDRVPVTGEAQPPTGNLQPAKPATIQRPPSRRPSAAPPAARPETPSTPSASAPSPEGGPTPK